MESGTICYYTEEYSAPTITLVHVHVLVCQKSRCANIQPYAIFEPSLTFIMLWSSQNLQAYSTVRKYDATYAQDFEKYAWTLQQRKLDHLKKKQ